MITHVVTFKFADPNPADLAEGKARLDALVGKVPSLRSMLVGINVVDSPRAHHLALVATYDDLDGLQAYQVHPDHEDAAAWLRSKSETIASVDFES